MNVQRINLFAVLALGLSLAWGLTAMVGGGTHTARADDDDHHEHGHKESELHESMEDLNKLHRKLRRTARDNKQQAESLKIIAEMQECVLKAKDEVPPMALKMPAEKRDKFVLEYRKSMIDLMRTHLDIEVAILDGDTDKASELVQSLLDVRMKGHTDFKEE